MAASCQLKSKDTSFNWILSTPSRQSLVEHAPWSEKWKQWKKWKGWSDGAAATGFPCDLRRAGRRRGGIGRWKAYSFSFSFLSRCPRLSDLTVKMSLMMTRNNSQCCLIYVPQMSRVPFVTFRTQFNCFASVRLFVSRSQCLRGVAEPFRKAGYP